jgi:hypothetical protein
MDAEEALEIRKKVSEAVGDLMGCYWAQINENMDDTDNGKIKVGFTVNFETAMAGIDMITKINFSKSVKDEREDHIDSNQMKLDGIDDNENT